MPKLLMLALALLISREWLTVQSDLQTGASQTEIRSASQPTIQARLDATEVVQMDNHQSTHAIEPSQTQPHTRRRAEAKITVHGSETTPFDQTAGPSLTEIRMSETFTGDIDGESAVRALEVRQGEHSARLVSLQRFRGKLGGREGTFVLQGSETVENGGIKATWFVVPGSGTGDLSGLRGEGGFQGSFGKGSDGTLDYWFE